MGDNFSSSGSNTGNFLQRHKKALIAGLIFLLGILLTVGFIVFITHYNNPAKRLSAQGVIGQSGSFEIAENTSSEITKGRSLRMLDGKLYLVVTDPKDPERKLSARIDDDQHPMLEPRGRMGFDLFVLRFDSSGKLCIVDKRVFNEEVEYWCASIPPEENQNLPFTLRFPENEYDTIEIVDRNGRRIWHKKADFDQSALAKILGVPE